LQGGRLCSVRAAASGRRCGKCGSRPLWRAWQQNALRVAAQSSLLPGSSRPERKERTAARALEPHTRAAACFRGLGERQHDVADALAFILHHIAVLNDAIVEASRGDPWASAAAYIARGLDVFTTLYDVAFSRKLLAEARAQNVRWTWKVGVK